MSKSGKDWTASGSFQDGSTLLAAFARKFVPTCPFKLRKIVPDSVPEHVMGDAVVFVAQDVPDACYLGPCDRRMTRLEIVPKMAAGFG